jgi:hypothetical protein
MSLVSVLPTELLERIMFAALGIPDREDEHLCRGLPLLVEHHPQHKAHRAPYYATKKHTGPWSLRNVCHQWRTLVESSPRMWSHIFIDDFHSRHAETLKAFLAYSGSSPLYISVFVTAPSAPSEHESFRILAAESTRWQTANIHLRNFRDHSALEFLRPLSQNLTRLHTLKLAWTCYARHVLPRDYRAVDICSLAGPNNPFTSLPSLRYLDLSGVEVGQQPTEFDFYFARLHQLALGKCLYGVIPLQCKCLTSLSLTSKSIRLPSHTRLSLPSLKHLDISHVLFSPLTSWLRDAVLTSLESLAIYVCGQDLCEFRALLSSLQCDNLRRLIIVSRNQHGSDMPASEKFIDILNEFPSVETLSIVLSLSRKFSKGDDWSDLWDFIFLLNSDEYDTLPRLRCLEIEVNVHDKADAVSDWEGTGLIIPAPIDFVEMLESRCTREGGTAGEKEEHNLLTELTWRSNCQLLCVDEDEERVRALEGEGLKFERYMIGDDDAALALTKYFF